jgi:hypothetical protein
MTARPFSRSRCAERARLRPERPAGDTPSKDAKAEAPKPNPDQVKASVEEDAQP